MNDFVKIFEGHPDFEKLAADKTIKQISYVEVERKGLPNILPSTLRQAGNPVVTTPLIQPTDDKKTILEKLKICEQCDEYQPNVVDPVGKPTRPCAKCSGVQCFDNRLRSGPCPIGKW